MSNGVKQGAVISPTMFGVYMVATFIQLKRSAVDGT